MHRTTPLSLRGWHPLAAIFVLTMLILAGIATPRFAFADDVVTQTVCVEEGDGCEFTSIQAAVQAALDEDAATIVVEIAPGTYTLDETLVLSGKTSYSLVGTDPATTIIRRTPAPCWPETATSTRASASSRSPGRSCISRD